jgi:hypothetical protein
MTQFGAKGYIEANVLNFVSGPLKRNVVVSLNLPDGVCEECGQCPVKCSVGFDVPSKIRDVVRLREVPPEFIG